MAQASWLFLRGSQSIWVERLAGNSLVIAGPGAENEHRDFISDQALDQFQVALAEKLTAHGWFLWPHNYDRRGGIDRRQQVRPTKDRRR